MPSPKALKPAKNLNGSKNADSLIGNDLDNVLAGKGGDDELTGGAGSDVFKFEKSLKDNGVDTITDYQWSADGAEQDVLDLTAALKSFKNALQVDSDADIADYVWLEAGEDGMRLMVDRDGDGGNAAEQWAFLEGLTTDDQVRVRAFTASGSGSGSGSSQDLGDGYYTLGGGGGGGGTIFVVPKMAGQFDQLTNFLYLDDGDGVFGTGWDARVNWQSTPPENFSVGEDTVLADLSGVDFSTGKWTVHFLSPGQGQSLWTNVAKNAVLSVDLSGFGSDDNIVIDFSQMQYWPDNGGGTTWGYKWISVSGYKSYTGWYLGSRSIFAGEYFGEEPTAKADFTSVYKNTKLASWSAGTAIVGSQITVLWPAVPG